MLFQCWPSVVDGGPTLKHHWFNVLCLLGMYRVCVVTGWLQFTFDIFARSCCSYLNVTVCRSKPDLCRFRTSPKLIGCHCVYLVHGTLLQVTEYCTGHSCAVLCDVTLVPLLLRQAFVHGFFVHQ